jgi:hypothetical protein
MSATRLLILGVLRSKQPIHGYNVRRELESWQAERWAHIAYGSIYFALNKMTVAACLRQLSSVLLSLQFGAPRQGMRPEAASLMRRDAGHLKHVAALLQERTGIKMPDLDDALSAHLGESYADDHRCFP